MSCALTESFNQVNWSRRRDLLHPLQVQEPPDCQCRQQLAKWAKLMMWTVTPIATNLFGHWRMANKPRFHTQENQTCVQWTSVSTRLAVLSARIRRTAMVVISSSHENTFHEYVIKVCLVKTRIVGVRGQKGSDANTQPRYGRWIVDQVQVRLARWFTGLECRETYRMISAEMLQEE